MAVNPQARTNLKERLRRRLRRFYYEDLHEAIRDNVLPGARRARDRFDRRLAARLSRAVRGVGIESEHDLVAAAASRFPHLNFVEGDLTRPPIKGRFDYVIVSGRVGHLDDVETFLASLRRFCHPGTRIIITYYNFIWEPVLKLAEALGLKRKEPTQNWLSAPSLVNLLELAGYEPVASGLRTVIPAGPSRLMRRVNRDPRGHPSREQTRDHVVRGCETDRGPDKYEGRGSERHRRHPDPQRARQHTTRAREAPPAWIEDRGHLRGRQLDRWNASKRSRRYPPIFPSPT